MTFSTFARLRRLEDNLLTVEATVAITYTFTPDQQTARSRLVASVANIRQESLADAKVSARQQCVYEDP